MGVSTRQQLMRHQVLRCAGRLEATAADWLQLLTHARCQGSSSVQNRQAELCRLRHPGFWGELRRFTLLRTGDGRAVTAENSELAAFVQHQPHAVGTGVRRRQVDS